MQARDRTSGRVGDRGRLAGAAAAEAGLGPQGAYQGAPSEEGAQRDRQESLDAVAASRSGAAWRGAATKSQLSRPAPDSSPEDGADQGAETVQQDRRLAAKDDSRWAVPELETAGSAAIGCQP